MEIVHHGRALRSDGSYLYVEVLPESRSDDCGGCALAHSCGSHGAKSGESITVAAVIPDGMTCPPIGTTVAIVSAEHAEARSATLLLTVPLAVFIAAVAVALVAGLGEAAAALCGAVAALAVIALCRRMGWRKPLWTVKTIDSCS